MKMRLFFTVAAVFAAVEIHAQSLQIKNVSAPGIYCHFNPGCGVSPEQTSASFTAPNLMVSCVLQSRSFEGATMNAAGTYGYEYSLTLNNDGERGTNFFTVNSLTLDFDSPQPFAFGNHASNQVWVVTDGGPGTVAPGSVNFSGTNVVIQFDPPLVLATITNKAVSTYSFGLISTSKPRVTTALLDGSTQSPPDDSVSFEAEMRARTP